MSERKSNGAIKIQKGITMPTRKATKYPWLQMKVGDSFVGPHSLVSQASNADRRYQMKFATRTEGNEIRVWRTE